MEGEAELTLVGRLQDGDASALEELMECYAARVYRLVYAVTRNSHDAEEVVQDVFLSIFRKVGTFEGRAALGTWIYRVAMNAALNKRRGAQSAVEAPLDDHLPAFKPDGHREGATAFLLSDWSRTPEDELLSREARVVLNRALDALPARYRAVLILRDVEGLSNDETSTALAEPIGAVKSCLHRARMALREQLTRFHVSPELGRPAGGHRC